MEPQSSSLPVRLALAGLRHYLQDGQEPSPRTPSIVALLDAAQAADDVAELEQLDLVRRRKAGCFVSYHECGELRGCIGTIAATTPSVLEEICRNTIAAGTQDPRFPPIALAEMDTLECSVDVLGDAEPVDNPRELDAQRYGVIVSNGWRRGLLLPALEGVETPQQQIAIALQKAGIHPHEPYELERFEVVRYE
jgi:AmmeMemoRadiSam system protein A